MSLNLAIGITKEARCSDTKTMAHAFITTRFISNVWSFPIQLGMVYIKLKVKEIWNKPLEQQDTLMNGNRCTDEKLHARLTTKYKMAREEVEKE